ncbi:MAG: 50S ribosomal protein L11 [Thermoproteota archaeon]|jgi:large subunit ribosomal protein L11|nr:50S ribosomal protein L11 [Thermoproteota archaeon]
MPSYKTFNFEIEGGKATGGPPIGPALNPLGVNVMEIVKKINEMTKDFAGMRVPVTVKVDPATKEYEIEIGVPSTAALLFHELKIEKGSGSPAKQKVGNLTMEQVVKIARIKMKDLLAKNLKSAAKEILGTCVSFGITVEGKDPREVQKEIDKGVYDHLFKE